MNIGIDGNLLAMSYHSGLRNYLKSLLDALSEIDKKNNYYIFANSKVNIPKAKNFSLVVIPYRFPILKRQIFIPLAVKKYPIDVFHYPCDTWISAFIRLSPSVVTLADFGSYNAYPKWYENFKSFLIGKYYNFMRESLIDSCDHILPISNTIKKEAVNKGISDNKLTTVHLGVDPQFRILNKTTRKNIFLAFADFSPRKNIKATLKAHALFVKKTGKKIPLVVITSDRRPHKIINDTAKDLGIKALVKVQTNASTKQLVKLYNEALALVYPSLYEGFGLPILEAMACGCLVITSNYGAMKEVASDVAISVNPNNIEEICLAMVRILELGSHRQKYVKIGLKRLKKFTWEKTAKMTLLVYKKIARKVT